MKRIYAAALACLSLGLCVLVSCISREAAAQRQTPAVGEEKYYTVSFYDGDVILQQLSVPDGGTMQQYPQGYAWRDAGGHAVDPATVVVTRDMTLYTHVSARVRTDHVHYLTDTAGFFRPDDALTRAEAAGVICALLSPETVAAGGGTFTDVPADSSSAAAIRTVSALGIMNGYADGTFRPDAAITRSEMITAMCRLTDTEEVPAMAFSDVGVEHWSMGSVAAAMAKGWINGYEDQNFYPDYPITRAETAVLVNRILGRTPDKAAIDVVCGQSPYQDVSKWYWAYYDIVDVAYSSELMSYILGEVENMQPGFLLLNDQLCHVNPETLKLDFFAQGFHTITDGLASDGLYYVPENGYFIRRSQPGLQEFDGSMFYVENADGPFAVDYDLGYLHFGENGRYTSGSEEVDGYVDAVMTPIIQGKTENLLQMTCLRQAFDYLSRNGGFRYQTRKTGWKRGTTSWSLQCARVMFETKKGACYYWAAAFLYLARRLGYQAYPVVGGVGTDNVIHAWVMIDDADGTEYIYDAELDWAYRTNFYHNGTGPMDMFRQRRSRPNVRYIFPGDTYSAPPKDDEDLLGEMPNIIWPAEVDGIAYVEINGEMVAMETVWVPLLDASGNIIGYQVTASYEGRSFSYEYMLDVTDPDVTPTPPGGDVTVSPEPTDGPVTPTDVPVLPTDGPVTPTDEPTTPTDEPVTPTDAPAPPPDEPDPPPQEPDPPPQEPDPETGGA